MSSEPSGPTQPEHVSAVDVSYTFGRPPSTYLSPREIVRVTILRSRLGAAADSELTRLPMSVRAPNAETTSVAILSTEPQLDAETTSVAILSTEPQLDAETTVVAILSTEPQP